MDCIRLVAALALICTNSLFADEPSGDAKAHKSKVYYVITQEADNRDTVRRLPFTGNETVLDALHKADGLTKSFGKNIWISRWSPDSKGGRQILRFNWDDFEKGKFGHEMASNYRLLPGDQLYIGNQQQVETLGRHFNRTRSGL